MILYVGFFTVIDSQKEREILQQHLDYVNDLLKRKIIIAKGPFTDKSGGLIIYNVSSIDEALRYINDDPVIQYGSREVEVREWKSTLQPD